jgi:hypothetical protein
MRLDASEKGLWLNGFLYITALNCVRMQFPAIPLARVRARTDFLKLSVPTARRMLRFWLVRGAAKAGA